MTIPLRVSHTTSHRVGYMIIESTDGLPHPEDVWEHAFDHVTFHIALACLMPVSFDAADPDENARVACQVLGLTIEELAELDEGDLEWVIHDPTGDASLLVTEPGRFLVRRNVVGAATPSWQGL